MGGFDLGFLGLAPKKWNKQAKKFFMGEEEKREQEQRSTLTPRQRKFHDQYGRALQEQGAGGAFGDAADYYRDLLSNDSETMQQLSAPETRRFNEEIIPGLSEQFAGMGSGGLSSSGFRNAAVNAGTDLSERLGAIRANLRQQGAQGLSSLGQGYLNPVVENIERVTPATKGFLDYAAPAIAQAATAAVGGSFGNIGNPINSPTSAGSVNLQGMGNQASIMGKSSPYGGGGLSQSKFNPSPRPNTYNNGMQGMRF